MNFHIEYRNPKDKQLKDGIGCINLVSKCIHEAFIECKSVVIHTLKTNGIYDWSFVAKNERS